MVANLYRTNFCLEKSLHNNCPLIVYFYKMYISVCTSYKLGLDYDLQGFLNLFLARCLI